MTLLLVIENHALARYLRDRSRLGGRLMEWLLGSLRGDAWVRAQVEFWGERS
jgi:hypothetical protein